MWAVDVSYLKFNQTLLTSGKALINSTYSGIMIEQDAYTIFKEEVMAINSSIKCNETDYCGTSDYSCSELAESLPEIRVYVREVYYVFPVSAYTMTGYTSSSSGCSLVVDEIQSQENS